MRRWPDLRPLEVLPALALAVIAAVEIASARPERAVLFVLVDALMIGPLALRRRAPVAVAALTITAVGLHALVGGEFSQAVIPLALAIAVFAAGRHRALPWSLAGFAIAAVPGLVALLLDGISPNDLALGMLMYGGPWAFGVALRLRSEQAALLWSRARRAEAEQEQRAREAVDRERANIARELHDVVSHWLSLLAIQAQAVRYRLGPDVRAEADDLAGMEQRGVSDGGRLRQRRRAHHRARSPRRGARGLGARLGLPPRPVLLATIGPAVLAAGVAAGLIAGSDPSWFAALGVPGNLLWLVGTAWIGVHAFRRRLLPRPAAALFAVTVPVAIAPFGEVGGSAVIGLLWLWVAATVLRDDAVVQQSARAAAGA